MTTVTLPAELEKSLQPLLRLFSYKDSEEFAREAIEDKVKQLNRELFFSLSDDVRRALERKGITAEGILREFEAYRAGDGFGG